MEGHRGVYLGGKSKIKCMHAACDIVSEQRKVNTAGLSGCPTGSGGGRRPAEDFERPLCDARLCGSFMVAFCGQIICTAHTGTHTLIYTR